MSAEVEQEVRKEIVRIAEGSIGATKILMDVARTVEDIVPGYDFFTIQALLDACGIKKDYVWELYNNISGKKITVFIGLLMAVNFGYLSPQLLYRACESYRNKKPPIVLINSWYLDKVSRTTTFNM